jgi:predicted dehydrogenase
MKKLRTAIIGTGSISTVHLDGYREHPDVEIVSLCDINAERAREKASGYKVSRVYTDYREMLDKEELDAVSVCTWNNNHCDATIAALETGVHVLCEKPMAMNTQEALRMQRAAEKTGKLLMIGFVRRFGNDAAVLKDFIDAGFMGEIYHGKATYLRRAGCPGGWFGNREQSGGGPLIDLGVHVIDFIRYFRGRPKAVAVSGVTFHKLGSKSHLKTPKGYVAADRGDVFNVEDFASALIRFDNGSSMTCETSFSLNIKEDTGTLEFFGTRAGARLNPQLEFFTDLNGYSVNITPSGDTSLSFDGLFRKEINHFVDCVLHETTCKSPAEDGVELMRMIDAIYESGRLGKEVLINRS